MNADPSIDGASNLLFFRLAALDPSLETSAEIRFAAGKLLNFAKT